MPDTKHSPFDFDVVVIGGSFAGLSAAIQPARARRSVLVIDSGLPRNRFARHSHGFLGQDGVRPADIIATARQQLLRYNTVRFIDGTAVSARAEGARFVVDIDDGRRVSGARIVLASGVRDELPAIDGLSERWGVGVLHCPYCHGYEVAGRPLGVLATSANSVHQAQVVSDWGQVTYFTQGMFAPNAEQVAWFAARGIVIEASPIVEVVGGGAEVEAVRLADGTVRWLGALFVVPRTHMTSELPGQLGCALDEGPTGPIIRVDDRRLTTVPGVFAAGDAANAMPNATIAAASGVTAGSAAHQSLIFA